MSVPKLQVPLFPLQLIIAIGVDMLVAETGQMDTRSPWTRQDLPALLHLAYDWVWPMEWK